MAAAAAVPALVNLVIVLIVLGLFIFGYKTIMCYFTKKEEAGVVVNDGCSCKSGAHGKWNDQSSKSGTMCCRSPNFQNWFAAAWCKDLLVGDPCMNDWQCETGLCWPGGTGASICSEKKKTGEKMDFFRAFTGCEVGTSGLLNDQVDPEATCCPTKDQKNNFSRGWCTNLPDTTPCIYDFQCTSAYCAPGGTRDSKCEAKLRTGESMSWNRGGAGCTSGTSALWNDKGANPGEWCCPTQRWLNNWGKGWCAELAINSECMFDGQCKSNHCAPGDTADSVCKPKKPAGEVADWRRGNICNSGKAGWWNDRVSNATTRCCPTGTTLNNWGKGFCHDLPAGSGCIWGGQCASGLCEGSNERWPSANGVCVNR